MNVNEKNKNSKTENNFRADEIVYDTTPKMEARRLRAKGKKPPEILDILIAKFGAENVSTAKNRAGQLRTVRNWVNDVEVAHEVSYDPYEVDESGHRVYSDNELSYLSRIQTVKRAFLSGLPLTDVEARHARRALIEFDDPYGERVDLVAQFVVIWEFAEREQEGLPSSTIESLYTFAPWRSELASKAFAEAIKQGVLGTPPILRLVTVLLKPGGGNAKVNPLFMGVNAHLGLPWTHSWFQDHNDLKRTRVWHAHGRSKQLLSDENKPLATDIRTLKDTCNWHEFLIAVWSGKSTEKVSLAISRNDNALKGLK